jgi:uncharacterized protein (DUF1015 family)
MPQVTPFRGIGYSLARFGSAVIPERVAMADDPRPHPGRVADLTDLACPPYDVISAEQREALMVREPHNAVRLELNDAADPHRAAADTFDEWMRDGTLEARAEASVYYYNHATAGRPDAPTVQGVLARVLLEPWGGEVRPHEHTMPGPKEDRLGLLRATRTQLSPILAIYFDRSERYRHLMGRAWTDEWRARDADGLLHQVAAFEPDARLLNHLSRQRLFVADGHHRYETALAYQAEVRSRPEAASAPLGDLAADWIMAVLVNAEQEELEVLATHRMLRGVDREALASFVDDPGPLFTLQAMTPDAVADALGAVSEGAAPVFGLLLPGDAAYLVGGNADAVVERMRRERMSTAVQRLDLSVLHAAILDDRLGIDAAAVGSGEKLSYTRRADAALEAVIRGEADAAFLVRPTRIDQLAAVANAADVMPQKSTYFHPKLLTGMAFYPLSEGED